MKKLVVGLAVALSTVSFAGNGEPVNAPAASGNDGIQKAIKAIKSECPNAEGKLSYNVEVTGICFVEGSLRKVSFWKSPNCPPNQICPQYVEEVGYVLLDCDDNVIEVSCATASF